MIESKSKIIEAGKKEEAYERLYKKPLKHKSGKVAQSAAFVSSLIPNPGSRPSSPR